MAQKCSQEFTYSRLQDPCGLTLLWAAWVERFTFASVSGGSLQTSAFLMVDSMNQYMQNHRSSLYVGNFKSQLRWHSFKASRHWLYGTRGPIFNFLCNNGCQLWKTQFLEYSKFLWFNNINSHWTTGISIMSKEFCWILFAKRQKTCAVTDGQLL